MHHHHPALFFSLNNQIRTLRLTLTIHPEQTCISSLQFPLVYKRIALMQQQAHSVVVQDSLLHIEICLCSHRWFGPHNSSVLHPEHQQLLPWPCASDKVQSLGSPFTSLRFWQPWPVRRCSVSSWHSQKGTSMWLSSPSLCYFCTSRQRGTGTSCGQFVDYWESTAHGVLIFRLARGRTPNCQPSRERCSVHSKKNARLSLILRWTHPGPHGE